VSNAEVGDRPARAAATQLACRPHHASFGRYLVSILQKCSAMSRLALITGGGGFIGSHLADELLRHGYEVRALDALVPQVHGEGAHRPDYLSADVELVVGDVRDPAAMRTALRGVDCVVHLAAAVGVGQSMYQVAEYTEVNNLGTAILMEALAARPVERLVVASSMSVYGEGLYTDASGVTHHTISRSPRHLADGRWDPRGPEGQALVPVPTPESKPPNLESIYALSKFDQERMVLLLGRAYGIPSVALRFFNVYGPRQALSNPYTGVLAIFAARYLNGNPPLIFEDGQQRRDFVHVYDVARACRLALENADASDQAFNIASGQSRSILDVAERMRRALDVPIEPEVTGEYRVGDIRHCTADTSRAQEVLGYQPEVSFDEGLEKLVAWLEEQLAVDRVDDMRRELSERGLTL
jgi:dTDP-L-rhamnose 4-epimerase